MSVGHVGFPWLPPPSTGLAWWVLPAKLVPGQERSRHASEVGPHNSAELMWLSLQQVCRLGTHLVTHVDYGQTRDEGRINVMGCRSMKGLLWLVEKQMQLQSVLHPLL